MSDQADEYTCKICRRSFLTAQSLSAHIDSEHPEAEQPEILKACFVSHGTHTFVGILH
jgi:hypothetical protein